MRLHQQAWQRYAEALRRFNEFLLSGEILPAREEAPAQEDMLRLALRVLACFTDVPPRVPAESDVQRLRDAASACELDLAVDELATAIVHQERKRRAGRLRDT